MSETDNNFTIRFVIEVLMEDNDAMVHLSINRSMPSVISCLAAAKGLFKAAAETSGKDVLFLIKAFLEAEEEEMLDKEIEAMKSADAEYRCDQERLDNYDNKERIQNENS